MSARHRKNPGLRAKEREFATARRREEVARRNERLYRHCCKTSMALLHQLRMGARWSKHYVRVLIYDLANASGITRVEIERIFAHARAAEVASANVELEGGRS